MPFDGITRDARETKRQYEAFIRARHREQYYIRQLRKIARHVQDLIASFDPQDQRQAAQAVKILDRYADTIKPWATATASRMLHEIARADERAWRRYTEKLGSGIRQELEGAPIGDAVKLLMREQVDLITSLPREAALRVHELAIGNIYRQERAKDIAAEIMKTGSVTRSRAELIARTECGRAATTFTMVRAQHIGSEGYIWRTAGDSIVRPAIGSRHFAAMNTLRKGSHRKLEGTFHRWDDPPIAGPNGQRAHAGAIFNCRCIPEPVIPEN